MNYTFLILKASYLGVAIGFIPLTYLVFNVFYFGFSYFMGDLADKFGKIKMMTIIYLLLSITAFIFTLNGSIWGWIGFIAYGIFMAGFQTVSAAVISDFTNEKIKGTAYGIYHTTIGLASFISLVLAGFLWDRFGANVPFYIASVVSIILSIALKILFSFKRDRKLEVSSES
jgi:MFS family permease